MSAALEAIYLPLVFLTAALFGGLRIAERIALLPPPLLSLVLALLLFGALTKCGVLSVGRLLSPSRPALANVNGLTVMLSTFLASAQAFNLATPESSVPRVLFNVLLLVLLANTLAASADRVRLLRSLLVIFGSAFILKFIVLASLSNRVEGLLNRALLALFEGVTLGTVTQDVFHPATGYVAFFSLVLFVFGLALLPSAPGTDPGGHDSRRLPP